jgi:sucrose phosphorylase
MQADHENERIQNLLASVYGPGVAAELLCTIRALARDPRYSALRGKTYAGLSQRDSILIAYADQVREPGRAPLKTLGCFLNKHLGTAVPHLHLLPFFPWSSDDGFAVVDYCAVAQEYGTWDDIEVLGSNRGLMFDAVFNHLSSSSNWFRAYLEGEPRFDNFFVTADEQPSLARVVRPRTTPLLTPFQSKDGPRHIWTTFGADQVDLNIANPKVFLALVEVLLFYLSHNARFIRLDAIAYWWKEIGTSCIHHPNTHALIRALRAILDEYAPWAVLITETNVPHEDNISYFGNGFDEAGMVYNFALPPLVLHSLQSGNALALSRWAAKLRQPSAKACFFNFLASHDGIGINPARGILSDNEIYALVNVCLERGGHVSLKRNPDASESPYELNINYLDALSAPGEPEALSLRKFITAHALMFSLQGVPGIYFHSLFGSRGDRRGAEESGIKRRINRQKLSLADLESELSSTDSRRRKILTGIVSLLKQRSTNACFSPWSGQSILQGPPACFAVLRQASETREAMLCLHNVGASSLSTNFDSELQGLHLSKPGDVALAAYETKWISLTVS